MSRERNIPEPLVPFRCAQPIDAEIAVLAARQHGVVSSSQLQALGLSDRAVRKRHAAGRLHRIHRSVYAVGHTRLTIEGRWMTAVLAGGPGSVLSHRPAGAHWDLRRWTGRPAITTPTRRRPNGLIEIHFTSLPDDERTVLNGIPITTVPRTLLDLATILDHDALVRALNEAEVRELGDALSLPALLERHRGERGAGALGRALDDASCGRGITREQLEERFATFVRCHRLPPPLLNAPVRAGDHVYAADATWPEARLIVELQSVKFHGTALAMTRDAERARHLTLAGWTILQVTWAQLTRRPGTEALARDLRALLAPTPARR